MFLSTYVQGKFGIPNEYVFRNNRMVQIFIIEVA